MGFCGCRWSRFRTRVYYGKAWVLRERDGCCMSDVCMYGMTTKMVYQETLAARLDLRHTRTTGGVLLWPTYLNTFSPNTPHLPQRRGGSLPGLIVGVHPRLRTSVSDDEGDEIGKCDLVPPEISRVAEMQASDWDRRGWGRRNGVGNQSLLRTFVVDVCHSFPAF